MSNSSLINAHLPIENEQDEITQLNDKISWFILKNKSLQNKNKKKGKCDSIFTIAQAK